jgi:tRNA(adenine34) deaminase
VDTTAPPNRAPLAQLDRAPDYGSGGYRFESCGVYQFKEAHVFSAPALSASAHLAFLGAPESARPALWHLFGVTLTEPQNSSTSASTKDDDERFMRLALEQARLASDVSDEVPIGAVVVLDGEVLASAHNETRMRKDPTAHAELLAISMAARSTQSMRLVGATVYTTVEPCFMCAGALSHARVARVVWGVRDPKFGGCVSLGEVLSLPGLNHSVEFSEGVCADEARDLLQSFFRSKRAAKAAESRD